MDSEDSADFFEVCRCSSQMERVSEDAGVVAEVEAEAAEVEEVDEERAERTAEGDAEEEVDAEAEAVDVVVKELVAESEADLWALTGASRCVRE